MKGIYIYIRILYCDIKNKIKIKIKFSLDVIKTNKNQIYKLFKGGNYLNKPTDIRLKIVRNVENRR